MHTLFDLLVANAVYGGSGGGGGSAVLEPLTAQANGVFTPPSGVDGFSQVTVSVPDPVLESLSVQANGIYSPALGVDGFNWVTVSLPDGDAIEY